MSRTRKQDARRLKYVVADKVDRLELAERLRAEATRSLHEAKRSLDDGRYPESADASRLAMEKFAKSILAACLGKYLQAHRIPQGDLINALGQVQSVCSTLPAPMVTAACARALVLSNMWSVAGGALTYGIPEVSVSPTELFGKPQAERALQDAEECSLAVTWLLSAG